MMIGPLLNTQRVNLNFAREASCFRTFTPIKEKLAFSRMGSRNRCRSIV